MAYHVKQNLEAPFNLIIVNEDDMPLLSLPLIKNDTATAAEALQLPENMPVSELAQRVALALSFVEPVSLMTLALGVQDGGAASMARAVIAAESAAITLKAMVVTLGLCAQDTSLTESERLKGITDLVEATGYAKETKVQEMMAQADSEINAQIAAGAIAPAAAPAAGDDQQG